jgi:hypothetical protein
MCNTRVHKVEGDTVPQHDSEMAHTHHNSRPNSSTHPMVTSAIDEHHGRRYAMVELQWGRSYLAGLGVADRHPADYLLYETGQRGRYRTRRSSLQPLSSAGDWPVLPSDAVTALG